MYLFFFFFNDTATTEIYTLSLHDALPIFEYVLHRVGQVSGLPLLLSLAYHRDRGEPLTYSGQDRKSTRLNSSHGYISYAVFCLKKKTPTQHGVALQLTGPIRSHSTSRPDR